MNFTYKNKKLMCEGMNVESLAKKHGTPLYVTSSLSIQNQYSSFEESFSNIKHLTCYAIKANYNLSILRLFAKMGSGADVGSSGELFRALTAGIRPERIVMSGVGKTSSDIEYAIKSKILLLKAESFSELREIEQIAKKLKVVVSVALRMNPHINVNTHANIATGGIEHKFGIDEKFLPSVFKFLSTAKNLNFIGLDVHVGSQIPDPVSYTKTIESVLRIKKVFEKQGYDIKYIDIGGGFPVTYNEDKKYRVIADFAKEITPYFKEGNTTLILEPGRYFAANAGILVTKVIVSKENSAGKNFIVVDAGMTELMRPALYDAYHNIIPLTKSSRKNIITDIVGPVCESTDTFAHDRKISQVREGEYLAIMSTGAYGSVMGSNYNGRLRPSEVLVTGEKARIIRKRETFDQMIQNEI